MEAGACHCLWLHRGAQGGQGPGKMMPTPSALCPRRRQHLMHLGWNGVGAGPRREPADACLLHHPVTAFKGMHASVATPAAAGPRTGVPVHAAQRAAAGGAGGGSGRAPRCAGGLQAGDVEVSLQCEAALPSTAAMVGGLRSRRLFNDSGQCADGFPSFPTAPPSRCTCRRDQHPAWQGVFVLCSCV